MKWRVLVTCPHLQRTIDRYRDWLTEQGVELEVPSLVQQLSEEELLDMIPRFDGVIAGDDPFTERVLEKGKRLKVVAKWGIGLDAIDQTAAQRLGIHVCNTPDVFADEVADVTIGYMILLVRQLHQLDRAVRRGEWVKIPGQSLKGKTLGVIGVGSIGRATIERATVMGMKVLGYDVATVPEDFVAKTQLQLVELDTLLEQSDFISLHCNLTSDNYHLLGKREFSSIKPGSYLINTARGALIDEEALVDALQQKRLAGAALDVFEREPLPQEHPLRQFDNCIFGTHNASNTEEAVDHVNQMAIDNLLKVLQEGSK
jgi:D-3-phosphoglycerate dehydrogenase